MSFFGGFFSSPAKPLPPKLTPPTPSLHESTFLPHSSDRWEHVEPAAPSPSDDASFVTLTGSQPEVNVQQLQRSLLETQQRNVQLQEELAVSRVAQREAESERTQLQSMLVSLRLKSSSASDRRSRREREGSVAEYITLKDENEKLKLLLQQQTEKAELALKEKERERAQHQVDRERLDKERDAAASVHREQKEKLKAALQKIDELAAERDRLSQEKDAVASRLTTEIERMKTTMTKQNEEMKVAFEEINRERSKTQGDLQKARKSLDKYAADIDQGINHVTELRRELSKWKDANARASQENRELKASTADLKQRLEVQTKDLKVARDESSALKKEFNQLSTLLDDRTSELKGAQSFLTTADAFSGAEVTSTLQRLNAEVLQSTAFMAESMVETFMPDTRGLRTEEQVAGGKRAAGLIGGAIVHFLGTKKHKDDPILIQIAFQAYFAYFLRYIATAWIIGGDEGHNQFIDGIYDKVRDAEAQAISGRWRALTRAHVPRTQLDEVQLTSLIASKMVTGLSDILLAAGCSASQSELIAALSAKFTEKISFLVSLAIRVNKIVGEDVTSGDLEVLAVQPATSFNAAAIEDSYDDGLPVRSARSASTAKVLCATDLGLRKRTRVATTGEKEKQWEVNLLLKPKVALESVIDIMDD